METTQTCSDVREESGRAGVAEQCIDSREHGTYDSPHIATGGIATSAIAKPETIAGIAESCCGPRLQVVAQVRPLCRDAYFAAIMVIFILNRRFRTFRLPFRSGPTHIPSRLYRERS